MNERSGIHNRQGCKNGKDERIMHGNSAEATAVSQKQNE
jgi:hypothetical protein